jgi:hypothetical protein
MSFNSFYLCTHREAYSNPRARPVGSAAMEAARPDGHTENWKGQVMIELRPFNKLGGADHGWLKAKHHFSFASYYDPKNVGHGSLRVWNDDEIAPNSGFPPHAHANMEIITYVREGAITHQDSMGNRGRTEAGDVQVMSAGSGVRHSEYNLEPVIPHCSRSGSSQRRMAASPPGVQSLFRKAIAQAAWSRSPADLRPTATRCRSAPMGAC